MLFILREDEMEVFRSMSAGDREVYITEFWLELDPTPGTLQNEALEEHYRPWVELAKSGVGVHCGEMGAYNKTPHGVVLAWMREVLEILTDSNIGYALWNFRGAFGVLDSGRGDVEYEDFHGHKLDRKMLELLRGF